MQLLLEESMRAQLPQEAARAYLDVHFHRRRWCLREVHARGKRYIVGEKKMTLNLYVLKYKEAKDTSALEQSIYM